MTAAVLKLVTDTPVRATPLRLPNSAYRTREHLTPSEVEQLLSVARTNRHGHRDALMILVTYRHGLRVSELIDLRWDQIDFNAGNMHVRRVKNGTPSTQPLQGDELRALRRLQREQDRKSLFVFTSERNAPFSVSGVAALVARVAKAAGFTFKAHPHMLRHGCGFKIANDGHDTRSLQAYLGHRNISNTVKYTELAAGRFRNFWR
jgi:site-specific recombinase XerD